MRRYSRLGGDCGWMYVLMCCSASSHGGLVIHIVSKIDDHRCISCDNT
jgi:hypothetical protein